MAAITDNDSPYLCIHEFIEDARANLPASAWDYLVGATETETTMRRNRQALDAIAFRPRVLRNVARVQTAKPVLGKPSRLPLMLAPVGSLENFAQDGAATAARAAAAFGVPIVVSSVTAPGLEATAAASGAGRRIFQLYTRGDEAFVDDHVRRAVDEGYEKFCITVDSAAYSRRERDLAKRHVRPWRHTVTGFEFQAAFAWDNVKRFKDRHDVPLILKGIQTAEDAAIAVEHGVDVIWASNHGGRQLDHCPGTMEILPEILGAVAGRAPVMVDGGFSRGTDILKALALGADCVAVGRLYCYALAAGGESALVRLFELLETELATDMKLLGIATLDALDATYVQPAKPVGPGGVHGAFPLIGQYTRGRDTA
jgi:isopentenyl diphosphate isomerase/L-lactate dehydrogenase-like FMN-dependent dehydrogenase